jgi:osmotically-inducible protein OsmY
MAQSDSDIQRAVLRELEWDTRLREAEIGVEVDRSIVTLSGIVTSADKRQAAQEAAHRVAGVLDVANDIEVKPPGSGRTDADIARAVRDALEWDVCVPDSRIRSTVSQGNVVLEGQVDNVRQREDAARALRELAGVASIVNRIEVAAATSPRESESTPRHRASTKATS